MQYDECSDAISGGALRLDRAHGGTGPVHFGQGDIVLFVMRDPHGAFLTHV
jgi:hypothetical protein